MVDLTRPIDELRRALNPKWRNKLSGAEKLGLEVIEGDTDDLYRSFMVLQREMLARKDYQTAVNYEEFSRVQSDLPKSLKMRIFLCRHESEVVSSAICSAMGNTGIYLLGATGDKGLKVKGSYLLQWRIMQWLQTHNFRWYDLGGINPEKNPGVYSFKAGLPGKEVYHMGLFESSDGMSSSLVVKLAEMLKQGRGAVRSALSRTRLARAQQ
jgi:lipid II:glycine glycyltransferase (peptidoglycan interpeptide bridge formation enzyme)